MKEVQLKLLSAIFGDTEFDITDISGSWFFIPDYILGIREKYQDSNHPCYVHEKAFLESYGIVKVYVRSASASDASPPDYLFHERHVHQPFCALSKDGVVAVIKPRKIGAANFRTIKKLCDEPDSEWQKFLYACMKRVS